jgi:hypothetical protein
MLYDYQKQQELAEARRRDKEKKARETIKKYNTGKNRGQATQAIQEAKNLAKNATPLGFFSLLFKISITTDWMYGAALFFAILKDISDFAFIGSFPLFGSIITILTSIFIGLMMLLGSLINKQGKKQYKAIRAYLILGGGTIAEAFLFGVNFIPIETLTVLAVWMMLLSARKQAEEKEKRSGRLAEAY